MSDKSEYVIVRSVHAGVFAGILVEKAGDEVIMSNCRRLWYWAGAASLSQLATTGTCKPGQCKFPAPVRLITVLGVIEIIRCTTEAQRSIEEVPVWKII